MIIFWWIFFFFFRVGDFSISGDFPSAGFPGIPGNVTSLLLDFSKAFDKVDHEGLIIKLENVGVPKLDQSIFNR